MPILSTFYGIVVRMYHGDHNPPHFHVEYNEFNAIMAIRTGEILAGKLPARVLRMVREWRDLYQDELYQCWIDAQELKDLKKIRPLE